LIALPSSRSTSLLLDVVMPDIDGLEVCRRLRADRRPASSLSS
jgi:CheY-like chemotaxis protein